MTNGDKLRKMSDEELADFLNDIIGRCWIYVIMDWIATKMIIFAGKTYKMAEKRGGINERNKVSCMECKMGNDA